MTALEIIDINKACDLGRRQQKLQREVRVIIHSYMDFFQKSNMKPYGYCIVKWKNVRNRICKYLVKVLLMPDSVFFF